jgi:hypothetical protein
MSTTTPARTNRFGGKCARCGQWVEAEAGILSGSRAAGWTTTHAGECPAPKAPAKRAEAGYFVKADGTMLVVVESRQNKGRTYAKRLVLGTSETGRKTARWEYAPGEAALVADVTPMTLEDAAAFGHAHGFCFKCCKPLTDPASVIRGIGPVCAKALTR